MADRAVPEYVPSPSLTPDVSRRGGALLTVAIVVGHAIKHVYLSGFRITVMPEIKIGLGLSNTMLGGIATSMQVTGGFTTLGAGYIGDRFSQYSSVVLAISLALMGLSFLAVGLSTTYLMVLGGALLMGLGPSLYHPPAVGALSRRFPNRRGFVISLHGTGGSFGEATGPLVAAAVVALLAWRATLQWSVIPAFAAAVAIWLMMRRVPAAEGGASSLRAYFGSVGSLLKNRAFVAVMAVSGLRGAGHGAVLVFLPVYLREDLEFSLTRVALHMSAAQLAGIVTQPLMGSLSDRFGRKAVLGPSMVALGMLFFALKYADPGIQLIAVIVASGVFLYSLHAIFIAAGSDFGSAEVQSTVVSLAYGTVFITGTFSPLVGGLIADSYGITSVFLYGGALLIAGGLSMALLRLPKTARQAMAQAARAG